MHHLKKKAIRLFSPFGLLLLRTDKLKVEIKKYSTAINPAPESCTQSLQREVGRVFPGFTLSIPFFDLSQ
jgi:hypothetical protein